MKTLIKITLVMIIMLSSNICYGEFREYVDGIDGIKLGEKINPIEKGYNEYHRGEKYIVYKKGNITITIDNNSILYSYDIDIKDNKIIIKEITKKYGKPELYKDGYEWYFDNGITIHISDVSISGSYNKIKFNNNNVNKKSIISYLYSGLIGNKTSFREYIDGIDSIKWGTDIKEIDLLEGVDKSKGHTIIDGKKTEVYELNNKLYRFYNNKFCGYTVIFHDKKPDDVIKLINGYKFKTRIIGDNDKINWFVNNNIVLEYDSNSTEFNNVIKNIYFIIGEYKISDIINKDNEENILQTTQKIKSDTINENKQQLSITKPPEKDMKGIIFQSLNSNNIIFSNKTSYKFYYFNITNDFIKKIDSEDMYCIEVDYELNYNTRDNKLKSFNSTEYENRYNRFRFVKRGKLWYGYLGWNF